MWLFQKKQDASTGQSATDVDGGLRARLSTEQGPDPKNPWLFFVVLASFAGLFIVFKLLIGGGITISPDKSFLDNMKLVALRLDQGLVIGVLAVVAVHEIAHFVQHGNVKLRDIFVGGFICFVLGAFSFVALDIWDARRPSPSSGSLGTTTSDPGQPHRTGSLQGH